MLQRLSLLGSQVACLGALSSLACGRVDYDFNASADAAIGGDGANGARAETSVAGASGTESLTATGGRSLLGTAGRPEPSHGAGAPALGRGGAAGDDDPPLQGGSSSSGGASAGGAPAPGGAASVDPAAGVGGAAPCVPEPERCDGVDNDCNAVVDDMAAIASLCASDSVCVDGACTPLPAAMNCVGYQYATHAYAFCAAAVDWTTARDACASAGGHLATIGTEAEDLALKSLLTKHEDAWIGLSRFATCEWEWVTGEPVDYSSWPVNYPDGTCLTYDCVQLWGQREGQWDDTYCTDEQGYLCEWERAP